MTKKILCVDDDLNLLAAMGRNLRRHFQVETADGAESGLKALAEKGPFAVIVSDMRMPGMDGSAFLSRTGELAPDTVRVMLTGNNDQQTAVQAVNKGHVFSFITKPCQTEVLVETIGAALKHYELLTAERELLEQTLNGSVKLLTDILSLSDPAAFGKSQKLRIYARSYLDSYPTEFSSLWEIELAAMLLNLGDVTMPPILLNKARSGILLTDAEQAIIESSPKAGAHLLSNIPRLEKVAEIVHYQNKGYDGSGFPQDEVKNVRIPFGSRLLKVLQAILLLEEAGFSHEDAIEQIQAEIAGFDPEIVQNCRALSLGVENSMPTQVEVETVAVKELHNRDVLASALMTKDGMVIAPKGTEMSNFILQKVRNFAALDVLKEFVEVRKRLPNPVPCGRTV